MIRLTCLTDSDEFEATCYLELGHDGEHVWTPSTEPTRRILHPRLPVYAPPGVDPLEHEWEVEELFAAADDADVQVVAVCPGGHYSSVFEAGPEGAVHADHQPCQGAWWFVEEVMVEDRLVQPRTDVPPAAVVALGSPFHNGCRFCGADHPNGACNTGGMPQ